MGSESRSTEDEVPAGVRHALAWVGLCLALAIHVGDEALTDFLSVYNPAVRSIRERVTWLPIPTFSFEVWMGGLIIAVIALSSLTVLALRRAPIMTPLSYALGVLMFANGLVHLAGSLQMQKPMPGVFSAPLLLVASAFLVFTTYRQRRRIRA